MVDPSQQVASQARPLPAFQCCTLKAGGPGIRSRVTYVTRMKGGRRVKLERGWAKGQQISERPRSQWVKGKALKRSNEYSTTLLSFNEVKIEWR